MLCTNKREIKCKAGGKKQLIQGDLRLSDSSLIGYSYRGRRCLGMRAFHKTRVHARQTFIHYGCVELTPSLYDSHPAFTLTRLISSDPADAPALPLVHGSIGGFFFYFSVHFVCVCTAYLSWVQLPCTPALLSSPAWIWFGLWASLWACAPGSPVRSGTASTGTAPTQSESLDSFLFFFKKKIPSCF